MKVSELTIEIVANYIRVEVTTASKPILDMVLPAAVEYCATYTGLSKEALDEYDDMAMAVMALCGEFYDNRTYTAVENAIINPTTQARLSTLLQHEAEIHANRKSDVMNELGQYPIVDTVLGNMFCGVIPQTGGLLSGRTAETTLARTTHKIICRYRNDIEPDMWLIIEGQRYNILYVMDPYLNKERLEIFTEVVI